MTARRPLDTTEWLEDMRRFAGRDAERAAVLLEELDELRTLRDFLELATGGHNYAARTGDKDVDEVLDKLKEHEEIEATIDELEGAAWSEGKTLPERIAKGVADLEARAGAYWDVRSLMMDAGVLKPGDGQTDILPLLRMFLPVD
jgi:hypothetical protein